ncbi:VapE domain-containing protein [Vreelandella alkaliphila]|uniref:VapE family protein n=1 Tax=Vreelandella alkaliphila TaxID=272774 RepID=A0AAJ2S2G7_9GAMM|nr:VapE domain-containing protein [Halomonas alkaliphila]MDX5979582.1 VapE family protein [Halomonas alkaliphila]
MAGRKSTFAHYVAALPHHEPLDMLGHFWPELQAAAAGVEASIDGVDLVLDGKRHYLKNLTGESDQRQYYIANLTTDKDETVWPEVTFGSFKQRLDNVYFKPRNLCWKSFENHKDNVVVDLDRHAAYREKIQEARKEAQRQAIENEQLKRDANLAAAQAADLAWQAASDIDPEESHSYLLNKQGLRPLGRVRVATRELRGRLYSFNRHEWLDRAIIVSAGDLLLPVYSVDPLQRGLINLQRIDATGGKRFLIGGQKQLGYMPLMPENWQKGQALDAIVVTEGYATGATLLQCQAFGDDSVAVAIAFDAGNLGEIASAMGEKYPNVPIINAADNDQGTPGNPGLAKAESLKKDFRIPYLLPTSDDDKKLDFDDLRQRQGEEEVKRQVEEQYGKAVHYWRLHHDPEYAQEVSEQGSDGEQYALDVNEAGDIVNEFNWPMQKRTSPGKPLATPENLHWMLNQYGVKVRYNKISKDVIVKVPGQDFSVDNQGNASLALIKGLCARNELPSADVDSYVKLVADQDRYNPVMDWIDSVPYDQSRDPIGELFQTIQLAPGQNQLLAQILLTKWLVGAAALAGNEGSVWSKSVLVFAGNQDLGKTSWFRSLVPESSGLHDCVADGLHLDPADKDSVTTVLGHWLVELGELDATFRKSDIARLKAFITRKNDQLRRPYDRKDSIYPRRTALFASVNETNFLQDSTGNSRWWTLEVVALNSKHNVDMQQVWAQAMHLYRNGYKHYLDDSEQAMLNGSNTRYEQVNPLEEMIVNAFDVNVTYDDSGMPRYQYDRSKGSDMTATQVLIHAGIEKPSHSQATVASTFLQKLTGTKARRSGKGNVYPMPPPLFRYKSAPQPPMD